MRESGKAGSTKAADKNTRTGLILAAVAAFFFVAVFVKHIWFR